VRSFDRVNQKEGIVDTLVLYVAVLVLFCISLVKDRSKTKKALVKGLKALENIMPPFITVIVLISIMLTVLNSQTISRFLGADTGAIGVVIAAALGAITLVPGFVAFPLAGELLRNGAGVMQIATFVSALMMVGIITLPMELSYFGKRTAILRNVFALSFSVGAAAFVTWVVSL
jgi:uncharacterized membrane protein YraQ (UPF0718 family)